MYIRQDQYALSWFIRLSVIVGTAQHIFILLSKYSIQMTPIYR